MRILLLSLAFASVSPAFAADTTASNPQAPQQAQAQAPAAATADNAEKAEKKICKREMNTESRMGSKRICLTAEQWKARESES